MGMPEIVKNGLNRMGNLSKPEPTQDEVFRQALNELADGKESKTEAGKKMQAKIKAYVDKNLEKREDKNYRRIAPGTFQTGFKNVVVVETMAAIRPTEFVDQDTDSVAINIIKANRDHVNNPGGVTPSDTFTLDNVLKNKPPNDGKLDQAKPVTGTDGYGNPMIVFQALHDAIGPLTKFLDSTHDEPKTLKNDDQLAWQRACWIAFLESHTKDQIVTTLGEHGIDADSAEHVAEIGNDLREKGLAAFFVEAPSGGWMLNDPDNPGDTLETLLNKLTGTILSKREADEGPAIVHQDGSLIEPKDKDYRPYMRTLMTKLDCSNPVIGQVVELEGKSGRSFYVGRKDAVEVAKDMTAENLSRKEKLERQLNFMAGSAIGKPLIVAEGESFQIRMPKRQEVAKAVPPTAAAAAAAAAAADIKTEAKPAANFDGETSDTSSETGTGIGTEFHDFESDHGSPLKPEPHPT